MRRALELCISPSRTSRPFAPVWPTEKFFHLGRLAPHHQTCTVAAPTPRPVIRLLRCLFRLAERRGYERAMAAYQANVRAYAASVDAGVLPDGSLVTCTRAGVLRAAFPDVKILH